MLDIPKQIPERDLARMVISVPKLEIRDVDAGEPPFLYSTGNWGPGYADIKGLVGWQPEFKTLTEQLALRLLDQEAQFDFIAGNATGGMIPAYQVREDLQRISGRDVPFIYMRNTRKIGGHQEYSTGLKNNPNIKEGTRPLVIEELVNFAGTVGNSAQVLKEEAHSSQNAATLFDYENPEAIARLESMGIKLVHVMRLRTALEVGHEMGTFTPRAIDSFHEFLANPQQWQAKRGLVPKTLGNE